MCSERGQASVEWIVLVLLLTLALAALARFAARADAGSLGADLLDTVTCAARGGCHSKRGAAARTGTPSRLVTVPPLVPVVPRGRRPARPHPWTERSPRAPFGRSWLRQPASAGRLMRHASRRAGALWRRSWVICLGYERIRYGVLHPEIRYPHQTMPLSEDIRIANDCLSPVDLIRDFGPPSKP